MTRPVEKVIKGKIQFVFDPEKNEIFQIRGVGLGYRTGLPVVQRITLKEALKNPKFKGLATEIIQYLEQMVSTIREVQNGR